MRRRDFLKATGTVGLFITFPIWSAAQEPAQVPDRFAQYPKDFNAYLKIGGDGRVTCAVGKVEMGQGNMTALAMLAAEELDVTLDQVDMLMGDTELCPWDIGTFGSLSVWQFGPVLSAAAAEARAVLLQLAAERLAVPVQRLEVRAGVVSITGQPGRTVSYGELVAGQRIDRHLGAVRPKPWSEYRLVGKDAPRLDGRAKVTGAAKYAADQLPEGLLHACVLRPPAHGASPLTVDVSAAERLPGVRVIQADGLVAVLHARPDLARAALEQVKATFKPSGSTLDDGNIFAHLVKAAPPAREVAARGSLAAGAAAATQVVAATYRNSYVAHAAMEPHSATARWDNGKLTVWASTQAPFMVRDLLAKALGLAPARVRIIPPYLGGGFGGKTLAPQALEAARLARAAGVPVQVTWDRREEFFLDSFRPAAVVEIRTGLSAEGRITFWDHHVVCAGDDEARPPYDIPNQRIRASGGWMGGNPPDLHPFEVGPWRAPAANTNAYARELHMDVLAAKAGVDPLEFRLRHLRDPRMLAALRAVAAAFGWTPRRGPSGRGWGVACTDHRHTVVAAMAEVAVDRASGAVQVKRVVMAQDMGLAVNPDGARQQMEGCITMGLGYALSEEVRFRAGRVLSENFDGYRIPTFSQLPEIQTILMPNSSLPAQGGGEPAIVVMGGLIANAVRDAIGVPVNQLPMTPERVRAALAGAVPVG